MNRPIGKVKRALRSTKVSPFGFPTGTADLPTGTAEFPTGTADLPTGAVEFPTGTADLPTGAVEFPTDALKLPCPTTLSADGATVILRAALSAHLLKDVKRNGFFSGGTLKLPDLPLLRKTPKNYNAMKKEEPVTHFKFSYAELEQLGDRSDELMARDATELAEYGVDATYRSDLAAKTQDLKDFPTDEELLGEAASATEIKDALADKLRVDIRAVMVRAKQVFKEGSAAYNRFGTKGLDTLSDSDLVRCARRVVRMGTLYMAQLAPKGLTPAILAALGAGATSLDDAIDDQDTALRARTVGTQERVELANALYDNIVELFDFGKDHWYTRNETKYNDYVIYDVPGGSGSAPIELTGEIPPMSTVNIKDGIAPKAKITVKNIGTVPFTVCSTDSAAESCTIGQVILPGGEVSFTGGSSGVPLLKPFLNATNNDPLIVAKYNVSIG